jgi:VIT1/CCC1 family predicted Fe2+/Mn2+ transporter
MEFFRNDGARTGLFFGATSGVITTIGDAKSDALGIHLAEEADPDATPQHVWAATISTFLNKFFFALSFSVPLLLLPLDQAVLASLLWGMLVIIVLSYFLARAQNASPIMIIGEHLGIAILVVVLSHLIGVWVGETFT